MVDVRISSETTIRGLCTKIGFVENAGASVAASAVATGLGVSLLIRVAELPTTRAGSVEDRSALLTSATALRSVQRRLLEAIDHETIAPLLAARKMGQTTERHQAEREAAIQVALRTAAEVPLEVMRLAVKGLRHAELTVARCRRSATQDVALAVALIREGLNGARVSLEQKLNVLTDETYARAVVEEIGRLSTEGLRVAEAAASLARELPA